MDLTLTSPVQYIPRVGPKMAKKLEVLGIKTVEDLLYYAPFRYNDFSLISPISRVQPGETVTIRGEVISMKNAFTKTGKKLQQAKVRDATDTLDVIWFNQMFLTRIIKVGDKINLSGKVDWFGHKVVMVSPEYELIRSQNPELNDQTTQSLHTGRLVPVYSETEGVSSKWLRGRIAYVLEHALTLISESTPEVLRTNHSLVDIQQAIQYIHFPPNAETAQNARYRLSFDEMLLIFLRSNLQKRYWQTHYRSHAVKIDKKIVDLFISSLPFALTGDQQKAVADILTDFEKPYPMNRLLEGDVGSGKTVVAAIATYALFKNGFGSILMAPTQILAQQHFHTISQFLTPLGVNVSLVMSGSAEQKHEKGDVIVGTHALLSESSLLNDIALIVIDEQQRFGVKQRTALREKSKGVRTPHVLTMTATPIPRTVAQTIYGNLDVSILTDMPHGREVVKTWVVPKEKRDKAYTWITKQLKETGGQAFIVCPFIEESETMKSVRSVKVEYKRLTSVFSTLRVGLLHGRMKSHEKTRALDRFRTGKDSILVATPVVEVGIDIPNAIIILIEAAERFGLAQLHQLRGRVGRGTRASYCLLFTEQEDELTHKRLKAMESIHNGPELAEIDLALRGPGELFGVKQHGIPQLRIASFSDKKLISEVRLACTTLLVNDPALTGFPQLRENLKKGTIETNSQD